MTEEHPQLMLYQLWHLTILKICAFDLIELMERQYPKVKRLEYLETEMFELPQTPDTYAYSTTDALLAHSAEQNVDMRAPLQIAPLFFPKAGSGGSPVSG